MEGTIARRAIVDFCDENDNVSFGGGGGNDDGYTQQCPGTQQQQQQLSQWNAFRNADARLTHSDRTATARIPERRIHQCGGGPYATSRSRSGLTLSVHKGGSGMRHSSQRCGNDRSRGGQEDDGSLAEDAVDEIGQPTGKLKDVLNLKPGLIIK